MARVGQDQPFPVTRPTMGAPRVDTMRCPDCEVLVINGRRCHELGCPSAWVGTSRECRECGSRFEPEHARQTCCDDSCHRAYLGLPSEDECDDGGTCCECGGPHECQDCPVFASLPPSPAAGGAK